MKLNNISRSKVFEQILEQFKANIASGQLKKGDKLPSERQLSEELGVSRSTVREAIKALEMIGLVTCVQGDGNYISDNLENSLSEPLAILFMLQNQDLNQVQQLRQTLEQMALQLAITHITTDDLKQLYQICDNLTNSQKVQDTINLDQQFHFLLASFSQHPLLTTMLKAISDLVTAQLSDIYGSLASEPDLLSQLAQQHYEIADALGQKDLHTAQLILNQHFTLVDYYRHKYSSQ